MHLDGQRPHILAINDSLEILILVREIFEEEGFRVTTRIVDDTHLEEIVQLAPDLIILNYRSEAELALWQRLTTDPRTHPVPIILCTGAVRQIKAIKPELDVMGINVVYKPFDIEHLVLVVRKRLGLEAETEESHPSAFE